MFSRNSLFVLVISQVAYSCIPTQQACSNCAPFYDSTCDPYSYGPPPPLCEDITTLSLSYTYSAGTCSIVLACNGGTPTFLPGGLTPAPGTVATCSESNGQWYVTGSPVNLMQCV